MVSTKCTRMVKQILPHLSVRTIRVFALTLLLGLQGCCLAIDTDSLPSARMIATFYADRFHGRRTSNGEIFDQNKLTAAHISIKLGTWVRVTNLRNDKQIVVKINDRCPKRNVLDLSRSAARSIGILGTAPVRVEILPSEEVAREMMEALALQKTDSVSQDEPGRITPSTTQDTKPTSFNQPATTEKTTGLLDSKTKTENPKQKEKTVTQPASTRLGVKRLNKGEKAPGTNQIKNKKPERYNIVLGHEETLKKARIRAGSVPTPYLEYVRLRPDGKKTGILMFLEIRQPQTQAEKTLHSLRRLFPDGILVKVDP